MSTVFFEDQGPGATNYLNQIPENVRRILIQLQARLRQTGEGLMAAHEDLDALIGWVG